LTDSSKPTKVADVDTADELRQLLRESALRVTRPRIAVLAAREHAPEVSHQTVYDALSVLTAAGLIRRIQPSGSLARYESRVGDNHHHTVCRSCGVIADVDCAVGEAPCLTPSDDRGALEGFMIDEAEVIYWGLCPECGEVRSS
jgi:Fur family ferric uptake transcriptional regulator